MMRLACSLVCSIATAMRHDPGVERMIAVHPRSWRFLADRFDHDRPIGLWFTVGVTTSLFFLFLFFDVVEDLLSRDSLVEADLRIVSLVQMFRTPGLDNLMLFFTDLGNWQIVLMGAGLLVVWLALSRRWLSGR